MISVGLSASELAKLYKVGDILPPAFRIFKDRQQQAEENRRNLEKARKARSAKCAERRRKKNLPDPKPQRHIPDPYKVKGDPYKI